MAKKAEMILNGKGLEALGFKEVADGVYQKGNVVLAYAVYGSGEIVSAYTSNGNLSELFALDEDLFADALKNCPDAMDYLAKEVMR